MPAKARTKKVWVGPEEISKIKGALSPKSYSAKALGEERRGRPPTWAKRVKGPISSDVWRFDESYIEGDAGFRRDNITPRQAASLIGVDRITVIDWAKGGVIPSVGGRKKGESGGRPLAIPKEPLMTMLPQLWRRLQSTHAASSRIHFGKPVPKKVKDELRARREAKARKKRGGREFLRKHHSALEFLKKIGWNGSQSGGYAKLERLERAGIVRSVRYGRRKYFPTTLNREPQVVAARRHLEGQKFLAKHHDEATFAGLLGLEPGSEEMRRLVGSGRVISMVWGADGHRGTYFPKKVNGRWQAVVARSYLRPSIRGKESGAKKGRATKKPKEPSKRPMDRKEVIGAAAVRTQRLRAETPIVGMDIFAEANRWDRIASQIHESLDEERLEPYETGQRFDEMAKKSGMPQDFRRVLKRKYLGD